MSAEKRKKWMAERDFDKKICSLGLGKENLDYFEKGGEILKEVAKKMTEKWENEIGEKKKELSKE